MYVYVCVCVRVGVSVVQTASTKNSKLVNCKATPEPKPVIQSRSQVM